MAITIGNKYYKINKNKTVDILRLYKIEDDYLLLKRENKIIKLTKEVLNKNYILLNPDGYMSFSIVDLDNELKDVIVTLHRKEDLNNNTNCLPYAVCRQNIIDIFADQMIDYNYINIGLSITRDSCPNEINFEDILYCSKVEFMKLIAVYIDDNLLKILSFINTKKYDQILEQNINNYKLPDKIIVGYSNTLENLLKENYFMNDFMSAFNIITTEFKIDINKDNEIIPKQLPYIEKYIGYQIVSNTVIKYSKDIDMRKIKKDYLLINDITNTLYILVYEKGNKIIKYC